jgi:hypothetical protein
MAQESGDFDKRLEPYGIHQPGEAQLLLRKVFEVRSK